ncbi:hypothetical protein AVEN_119618-1 [Araneus ventricosus]|uniref:Uncharacterized protein n=1 Tax=Araneus ventricosus TaxID=182803 RepID=A0A4Y2RIK3_ARAVE|nr:hypothetical protein AVEN_119618-1 [Araneus ventricosus]
MGCGCVGHIRMTLTGGVGAWAGDDHFVADHSTHVAVSLTMMFKTFARSYTVGIFPMGPSQGTGCIRGRSDNTNGLSCSSAYLYTSVGPRDAATCDDKPFHGVLKYLDMQRTL